MRVQSLMAVLVLGGAVGLARADDKPLDRADLNKRVANIVYESAKLGTDVFNRGGHAECASLYKGTLMAVAPLLDHQPKLQADVRARLDRAAALDPVKAAIELRAALDEIQNTLAPPVKKDEPKKDEPKKDEPKKDEPKKDEPKKDAKKTLWERLGGEKAVKAVVHDFVLAAAEDPKVNFFRDGKYKPDAKGVERLETLLVEMVSEVTGGPLKYSGRSMKESHKGMAITEAEFDALAGHLIATLKKYKVPQAEIDELVKIVASTKGDIVEKKN